MEAYRDQYATLFNNGKKVVVIGISTDADSTQANWARESGFPVVFASDPDQAVAKRLDLDLGRKYREYSHGNKQKLALLLAFAPRAGLLILDEPTSGLDPLHQQEFYGLVRDARSRGATVFMSSHVLSEVEHVCDRVGIVREGHLATVGTLDQLTGIRAHHVRIEFADAPPAERLRELKGFEGLVVDGRHVTGLYRGSFDELLGAIAGSRVATLESREPTLEEVFLSYYSGGAA